jgi:hypothetical protein
MFMRCTCKNESQDEMYGPGIRVHNPCKKKQGTYTGATCTVCGKEQGYAPLAGIVRRDQRGK